MWHTIQTVWWTCTYSGVTATTNSAKQQRQSPVNFCALLTLTFLFFFVCFCPLNSPKQVKLCFCPYLWFWIFWISTAAALPQQQRQTLHSRLLSSKVHAAQMESCAHLWVNTDMYICQGYTIKTYIQHTSMFTCKCCICLTHEIMILINISTYYCFI